MTEISRETWLERVNNLMERRKTGVSDNRKCEDIVADYGRHLRSFELGTSLLDVGCGDQSIKKLLDQNHKGVKYVGIDPFPVNKKVHKMEIEDPNATADLIQEYGQFDNVICFAMLDSSYDPKAATENMKKLAKESVVFLTGIDIEPDEYHTIKIGKKDLDAWMMDDGGWYIRMSNFLTPHVLLIEYAPLLKA